MICGVVTLTVIGSGVPGGKGSRRFLVGFESALEFWRDDSNLGTCVDCIDPDGKLSLAEDPRLSDAATLEADLDAWSMTLSPERPLDVLALQGAKTDSDLVRVHQLRSDPPRGSFVRGRDGVLIARPELVFLQAAASYGFVELLKLGMELCGGYAPDRYEEYGCKDRPRIASAASIRRYLDRCKNVSGIVNARRAARLLIDNSRSPLESQVVLGLTLPPRYRGLGLRKPTLNSKKSSTSRQAEVIGEHGYVFDIHWAGTLASGRRYSVDLEVDSNPHFTNPGNARADGVRRDNVQFMGSTHVSITTEDFHDAHRFAQKGLIIASYIGQRIRRYPRRGTDEEKRKFDEQWEARVDALGDLLQELAADGHPPRPRPH